MEQQRIALFVDGDDFFYTQREDLKWWVDPKLLLEWAKTCGDVVEATYYSTFDPSDKKQLGFFRALPYMGYNLISKPLTYQGDSETFADANLNCDIVADIFCTKDRFDTVFLVSGNQDFASSLKKLRAIGKGFKVLSSKTGVANEIREVSGGGHFIDLNDIRSQIEKTARPVEKTA